MHVINITLLRVIILSMIFLKEGWIERKRVESEFSNSAHLERFVFFPPLLVSFLEFPQSGHLFGRRGAAINMAAK